jgi:threonine aldolase
MKIDLRSDTVTKPTPEMLQAMMAAKVGDDVYGEDDSVVELEQYLAKEFGMEAGLFCPSGTMTNQIAIRVHARPATEVICADNAHVFKYEGGGIAANTGAQARLLPSTFGKINAQQIVEVINAEDVHFPRTALVCLENTSNRGGGSIYTLAEMNEIANLCKQHQLPLHLDGARIYNALAEGDYTAKDLGKMFNSISVCLSKGLGAPVGSVLLGNKDFIHEAKRVRKLMGGGMRQAGYLAAAGMHALKHHLVGLKQDHAHAQKVAAVLNSNNLVVGMMPVVTNIIIFKLKDAATADALQHQLKQQNILANKVSATELRFVFHLDVRPAMVDKLCSMIEEFKG